MVCSGKCLRRCCGCCCSLWVLWVAATVTPGMKRTPSMVPSFPASVAFYDAELMAEARAAHADRDGRYVYPGGRGRPGSYGNSEFEVRLNLSSTAPSWRWPAKENQYSTMPFGVNIDDRKNLYLSAVDGLRKFSPDGAMLWEHSTLPHQLMNNGQLYHGAMYNTDQGGHVRAVSMETGKLLWQTRVSDGIGANNGFTTAHDGVVVSQSTNLDGQDPNYHVCGLNATDGTRLWVFKPDRPVWNFMASFAGDGTFVFMDVEGKAYRCRLSDGSLVWKAGGQPGTWTDATLTLGPNNAVYAQFTPLFMYDHGADLKSGFGLLVNRNQLSAYALADGRLLWRSDVPLMATNAVAVGRLHGREGLSVVQPAGMQTVKGQPTAVYAYDAETGRLHWTFHGPRQKDWMQQGDLQGLEVRRASGLRQICLPNPWSSPTIDAAGTVYVGNQDGVLVGLRDADGDGEVSGPGEVHVFDTVGTFAGSTSPAIGPGILAAANCDTLWVWRA